ncbi:MAG: 1-deoxy-D-xylulose-5-phosphate synthase [Actinobacteria bacterium RBG_16_64_13]|nr:MAG: 1-deoxy-D-xylulose-5-phosphate synthase [Actinobacteria bacterium RBG_16_64_13]
MSTTQDRLIDSLDLPAALRRLDAASLRRVADEVRNEIIETISLNGGHLGASLGVVELTVALHAELDTPRDAIVWDVGHQSYAHKLLTGRLEAFGSIRTYGGLSGFPLREESEYDAYGTGHSSTSVSAAVGMVEGRRCHPSEAGPPAVKGKGEHETASGRVVAVIGDGALTGGMAYEALNHAGHLRTPVLVILNDNTMSIEKNVGAMSTYLSRLRTDPALYRFRRDLERRLQKLPGVGDWMAAMGEQLKDSIKAAIVPGMLFEDLGFTYVGVIDGHDIEALRASIRRSLAVEGPVLLHCRTVKGKGYAPAEEEPGRYHGIPRFSVTTGESLDPEGPTTFTQAFGEALVEMARADERVVGITAAMATGTGLDLLKEAMPERFFDVGIAEAHAVGFAAGLAVTGKRPVVAIYSTFLQRAYDQIILDVCLQRLPVVFAVDRAGLVGADGPTHHGAFDLSFLRIIPGLTVYVPKDEAELQRMLATALQMDGPTVIRYPRSAGVGVPLETPILPLEAPWVEVMREGSDVLLLTAGPVVSLAEEAAKLLGGSGIGATVAGVKRVHPLDVDTLVPLLLRHKAVVTVEDNALAGGFGSAVLELMSDQGVARPAARAGLPDAFVAQGPVQALRRDVGLTAEAVASAASRLLEKPCHGRS